MKSVHFKTENGQEYGQRLVHEFQEDIDNRLKAVLLELGEWTLYCYNKPVVVTCLNRTKEENDKVNGHENSAHLFDPNDPLLNIYPGRAADIRSWAFMKDQIPKIVNHLEKVWGKEFLNVKYHNSGSGDHIHINIKWSYRRKL